MEKPGDFAETAGCARRRADRERGVFARCDGSRRRPGIAARTSLGASRRSAGPRVAASSTRSPSDFGGLASAHALHPPVHARSPSRLGVRRVLTRRLQGRLAAKRHLWIHRSEACRDDGSRARRARSATGGRTGGARRVARSCGRRERGSGQEGRAARDDRRLAPTPQGALAARRARHHGGARKTRRSGHQRQASDDVRGPVVAGASTGQAQRRHASLRLSGILRCVFLRCRWDLNPHMPVLQTGA